MRRSLILLSLALSACTSDYGLTEVCISDANAFDIEDVSRLQDAAGFPSQRDAVVLDFDTAVLGEGETWRIARVDLLAMVPDWVFDRYDGGDVLTVEIWDADSPRGAGDWSVSQPIQPSDLDWSPVTLSPDAFWAGTRNELQQHQAWMSFDFSEVIPEDGMTSGRYTVGVSWPNNGLPTIGYSNFNLACSANYTDYGSGQWELNSADGDGNECSWPMMRVGVETQTLNRGSCDGEVVER